MVLFKGVPRDNGCLLELCPRRRLAHPFLRLHVPRELRTLSETKNFCFRFKPDGNLQLGISEVDMEPKPQVAPQKK